MNQSIYTERENILPHHAEWLDGCGATWLIFNTKFSTGVNARMGNIIFNGMKQNGFSHAYDPDINYIHIPTGTEFCECVAEILGLPKPTFEVDISKTETTTEPIKGMAIEVSRLSGEDKDKLSKWDSVWGLIFPIAEKKNYAVCYWPDKVPGHALIDFYKQEGFTITESPTEFLKYVKQQTGKEYKTKEKNIGDVLNEKFLDLFDSPTYPHKIYRILDSLDGIPLDTRIPLSECIPPFGVELVFIDSVNWVKGCLVSIMESYVNILVEGESEPDMMEIDGHWMRIV